MIAADSENIRIGRETVFTRDFILVWDWENSREKLQCPGGYEASIQTNIWESEHSKIEFEGHLEKATRTWNIALILGDAEEYQKAEDKLREEDRPDTLKSQYGLTPISWASGNRYDAVVKLLLRKDGVDPDLNDSQYGRTPLSWAAGCGHEAVVKLLLGTGRIEVNSKDDDGRTPLSWAAENGHEIVVKLLFETGKVEVNSKDRYGQTPLWRATNDGHEAVVKLLLEMGKVEVNSKNSRGQTPLLWAAKNGHEAVVKLLLETGKVEVDSKDNQGLHS